jgi:hypothetical protein
LANLTEQGWSFVVVIGNYLQRLTFSFKNEGTVNKAYMALGTRFRSWVIAELDGMGVLNASSWIP